MKKTLAMLTLATILLVGLTIYHSKPDMPMEIEVDGVNIILGQTTVRALTSQGYKVNPAGHPSIARDKDKHLPFNLSLSKGAGEQIFVGVYVPYGGGRNISAEQRLAIKEGTIYRVTCTPGSTKKIKVIYNKVELKELTLKSITNDWGCKPVKTTSLHAEEYSREAKNGTISVEAQKENLKKITVQVSYKKFLQLQQ